jgi:hypothetical protein
VWEEVFRHFARRRRPFARRRRPFAARSEARGTAFFVGQPKQPER